MYKKPSLLLNAVSNWVALIINITIAFYMTPLILKFIGKEGYGIWTIIMSIIGYYGVLDLGISSAISRYIARYAGKRDSESLNKTASTSMIIFSIIGIIIILCSVLLAEPISYFFNISYANLQNFKYVMYLLGLMTAIYFPNNVLVAIIKAHEHFIVSNIRGVFIALLRTGLTILLFWLDYGLLGIAFSYLVSSIIESACNVYIFKIKTPQVKIRLQYADLTTIKKLMNFGFITFIITISDQIRFNLDSFVIGKMINVSSVAVFRIAGLIVQYIGFLVIAGTSVFSPRFAMLHGQKDYEKLKDLFLDSLLFASLLSFGILLGTIVFGGSFIQFWVGNDFKDAVPVLWVLTLAFTFDLSQNSSIGVLYAINKHKFYAYFVIIEAACNLALSIILAPYFGILGVALGTAIPMILIKFFIQPIYVSRLLRIHIARYYTLMLGPFIIIVPICLLAWQLGIVDGWNRFSFIQAILISAGCMILYIILNFAFFFRRINVLYSMIFRKNQS